MKLRALGLLALAAGVMLQAAPLKAHHSFAAEFDAQKVVKMKGYATKVEWTNPHVWFYLKVTEACTGAPGVAADQQQWKCTPVDASKNPIWGFEMGPPHGLQTRGWTRTTMKLGDEIVVVGTLARNGDNRGNARTVTMAATGKAMGAASSETEGQ